MNWRMSKLAGIVLGAAVLACLPSAAVLGNVYPSGVVVDTTGFDGVCGTAEVTYVLNEDANGDGINPGVKIEVLDGTSTAVRTVTIARQPKGTYVFEWDGRKDDGSRADNGNYTVRITATDFGYPVWTRISDESALEPGVTEWNYTHFERPMGIAVNKNPASEHYGRIYVSQASNLTTVSGRACADGIYVMYGDASPVSGTPYTGGVDWATGDDSYLAPWKSNIGPDDHLYVSNFNVDLVYEFNGDMSVATQLIDASNKTADQYAENIVVVGTQAGGNRKVYLTNSNYYDTARKGLVMYDLAGNATATGGDTGIQYIGPGYFTFYPKDFARDSNGDWYVCQYRYSVNEAPPLSKFEDGIPPLNTPLWEASQSYTGAYGIDIDEDAGWVAYGQYYTGYVYIFDMATGGYAAEFDAGARIRDLAFDAAGNIYTVDQITERLRIWSPPDGVNSKDVETSTVALNKSGTGGPTITDQPDDVIVCAGDSAVFNATATSGDAESLDYQWKKNGQDIAGESGTVASGTQVSLTLLNVQAADAGALITVEFCDDTGSDTGVVLSASAILNVGVSFLQAPVSQTVCAGTNATFTVSVIGKGAITYQWQEYLETAPEVWEWVNMSGQTTDTLTLGNVQYADSGRQFRCVVTDECGAVNSPSAILQVRIGPTITFVGWEVQIAPGGNKSYICTAYGMGAISYQWAKDGVPLSDGGTEPVVSGATSATITLTGVPYSWNGAIISCWVTDNCGQVKSEDVGISATMLIGAATENAVPNGCSNAIDDDNDGYVDCDDADCDLDPACGGDCPDPFADADEDNDVDHEDFGVLQACMTGDGGGLPEGCGCFDRDGDLDVDGEDYNSFELCASGPAIAADPTCDDPTEPPPLVVINEIVYDDTEWEDIDDREYIELYNADTVSVDISGWIIRTSDTIAPPDDDNPNYKVRPTAPGSVVLAPGEYYVMGANTMAVDQVIGKKVGTGEEDTTNLFEDDNEAVQLVDRQGRIADTVVYELLHGAVAVSPTEGGIFGHFRSLDNSLQSLSRYKDGLDTGSNGYDFGIRALTPGTSNLGVGSLLTAYVLPNLDALTAGASVPGLLGSFVNAVVIDPGVVDPGDYPYNPSVIPAPPGHSLAMVAWDPEGGGNMIASDDVIEAAGGGYDVQVYIEGTLLATDETEVWAVGIGTTGTFAFDNEETGIGWVYQRNETAVTLTLYDGGAGGGLTAIAGPISLTGQSGWKDLTLSVDAAGNVTASFDGTPYGGTTIANLVGSVYFHYRELIVDDAQCRPLTVANP